MASTACPGTVLVFSIINSSNFIHFTCLRVVSRDFLKTRFTKCAQNSIILFKLACTTTVQYRMVYFVPFHSFWPFNSKLGSIYSFQLSGGLAPWQCCFPHEFHVCAGEYCSPYVSQSHSNVSVIPDKNCNILATQMFVITLELVLIDWNWIPLIQLNYWCLRVDNSTWTSLLRCL